MNEKKKGTKQMGFVAVCQYPDHKSFCFHSPEFFIDNWHELEIVGKETVERVWKTLSPYPVPPIVEYLPGSLVYRPNDIPI